MDNKIKHVIITFLRLFHVNIADAALNNLLQFIKFGIVGLSNTVISYILNIVVLVLLRPLHVGWDFVAGNVVAFILSVLWSFYWNSRFVFKTEDGEQRSILRTLMKIYISYGFTGIVLNNILAWLWINQLGISKFVAPLINLIISVPLNFLINKLWAFKTQ